MYFLFVLSIIFFSESNAKETILVCYINEELENNSTATKKVYKDDPLNIFFDKDNQWINDFSFSDWKKQKNNNTAIEFISSFDSFLFKLKIFHNQEKRKLESVSKISITKKTNYIEFIKYYYDYNDEIFFTTEVRGICE